MFDINNSLRLHLAHVLLHMKTCSRTSHSTVMPLFSQFPYRWGAWLTICPGLSWCWPANSFSRRPTLCTIYTIPVIHRTEIMALIVFFRLCFTSRRGSLPLLFILSGWWRVGGAVDELGDDLFFTVGSPPHTAPTSHSQL